VDSLGDQQSQSMSDPRPRKKKNKKKYIVPKAYLYTQSVFFKNLFEAGSDQFVNLGKDKLSVFELVIQWIYH